MSEKNRLDLYILRRLFRYVSPYKRIFFIALFCMILLALLAPYRPYVIVEMVNSFVIGAESDNFLSTSLHSFLESFYTGEAAESKLVVWTVFLISLLVIESIIQFFATYLANLLGQSIIRDIRTNLYKHINAFKLKYFDTTPNGTIVTRVISDIEAIADVFSLGLLTMLGDILKLIVVISFMSWLSWELTLLVLVPIPLLLIATRIFARAMKRAFQKERVQVTRLNTFVQEHISGMSIVQLFNRQKMESNRFRDINSDHRQAHFDAIWANSIFFPIVELLSSISIAVLIMWGLFQLEVINENSNQIIGVIFGFILWIHMLYRPIRMLADKFNILQRGIVRAERVFSILDMEQHIDDRGTIRDPDFDREIVFKDVWFAYRNEEWVLKGIDFKVEAGKSVALVGTTGAGKSTIVNLLSRFYEFQKGTIQVGDHSIRDIELESLRQGIAVVLQDVFLFSDTIYNNITLGDTSISREAVILAAKKVGAHDFIHRLPGGYDFNVRERGGILSVGQRQLISFIRAYVYNPKILILDEATASVDSQSEELIQNATKELQKGRTSIVIAHRLSTIVNSDEILVIEDGRIIEKGNHNQLIEQKGHYYRLYELNFT
ncbi:ABC transporter ATP-binding protein [bacterium AH-315-C20]|nr:ABC transporter ATP-binding protein [bacterium AH-315-C20]